MTAPLPRLSLVVSAAAGCLAFAGLASAQTNATPAPAVSMELTTPTAEAMHKLDPDGDGTINWKEAYKASAKHFEVADLDHDGTLDQKEAAATGISAAEFQKADIDQDGTLDKKEYAALVKSRFLAADPDKDGTVSAKELGTSKGQALLALVK
jgi:Ca2+-binding EF-hand superfamily protein